MTKTNVQLISDMDELEAEVRELQSDLSIAYGTFPDSDGGSMLLDEAGRALNAAVVAIDDARMKVAAHEGLTRARDGR